MIEVKYIESHKTDFGQYFHIYSIKTGGKRAVYGLKLTNTKRIPLASSKMSFISEPFESLHEIREHINSQLSRLIMVF